MLDIFYSKSYEKRYRMRKHKGYLLFLRLFIWRCFVLTTCISAVLLFMLKKFGMDNDAINFLVGFVAVFIEEQARWTFANYSNNVAVSQFQFAFLVLGIEFAGYYVPDMPMRVYLAYRAGSFLVHPIDGVICYFSFMRGYWSKLALFGVAVAFHCYMNFSGGARLAALILSAMHVEH